MGWGLQCRPPTPPLCHSGLPPSGRTELVLSSSLLSPSQGTGELPSPTPSHFDGVCDISCCEVKEGPLRPAPFSCSLLVRVSVFPLVRLSSKQVMVEGSHTGQLQTWTSLHPTFTFSPHSWAPLGWLRLAQGRTPHHLGLSLPTQLPGGGSPARPPTSPWGDCPDFSPAQTWGLPLFAPLQTRTSALRITAAASKTVSTPSAATSVSVAAALYSMTTNMTARKLAVTTR